MTPKDLFATAALCVQVLLASAQGQNSIFFGILRQIRKREYAAWKNKYYRG